MYKNYFFLEGPADADPFRLTGAAARQALAAAVPAAEGFTQTRSLAAYNGGEQIDAQQPAAFSGVLELWFGQREAALDTVAQAQALAPLLNPRVNVGPIVSGRARTVMRLAQHHTGQFIKGVFPFRRKAGLSVEDFQRYWWLQHAPIAALTEQAVYYLQCHPLAETYAAGRPPFDGITELHWPSVAAARAAMASRQMREDQSNDAANFVEPDSVILFLAAEEEVLPA